MKKLFSALIAFLIYINASAQYSLVEQFNPGANAWFDFTEIATDQQDNTIVAGNIYNTTVNLGSITLSSPAGTKRFIAKKDNNHNWLWVKTIQPNGWGGIFIRALAVDNAGNIYLSGSFYGTVMFDNISLTSTSGSAANISPNDMFVAKMSSGGNFVWAKKEGTKNGSDGGNGITVDGSGNVYVTGYLTRKTVNDRNVLTSGEITDIYLVKYNSNGNKLWEKKYSNGVNNVNGLSTSHGVDLFGSEVSTDASGNVYFTGGFYSTVSFGNGSGLTISASKRSAFLAKLNSSGTAQWVRTAIGNGNGNGGDSGSSIFIDNANNVFWGGTYWGTSSVIGGITLSGQHNFLTRFSSAGTLGWAVNVPNNDYFYSIGGIDINIFRSSSGTLSVSAESYGILEISTANGSIISEESFSGWNTTGNASINGVAATSSGFIFTGKVLGTVGFGGMTLTTGCTPYDSCFNEWIEHAWIATYTNTASRSLPTVANEIVSNGLKIFPNPASNQITLSNGNKMLGNVTIYDLSGRIVYQNYFSSSQAVINLQRFMPGVYYLRTEQSAKAIKFVKQ